MEETKPLTPIDVFNGILRLARESGNFKEVDVILESSSPTYFDEACLRPIYNEELDTEFRVDFGGSEWDIYRCISAWFSLRQRSQPQTSFRDVKDTGKKF